MHRIISFHFPFLERLKALYNKELEQFRKGTSLFRKKQEVQTDSGGTAMRSRVVEHNGDIIGDDFRAENSHILGSSSEGKKVATVCYGSLVEPSVLHILTADLRCIVSNQRTLGASNEMLRL